MKAPPDLDNIEEKLGAKEASRRTPVLSGKPYPLKRIFKLPHRCEYRNRIQAKTG